MSSPSLVFRESELVGGQAVWKVESTGTAGLFVACGLTLHAESFHTSSEVEEGEHASVHHEKVHHAGALETQGAVFIENAHGDAENLS